MKSIVKMIAIKMLRIFMRLFYIFPIKENRIIFNAYRGSQYACNPKYISEYLMNHYPNRFEIIWAFDDPSKFRFLEDQGIVLVKFNSLKRFYYEATAKISVNNVGSFSWLPVRKNQEHINTWHGGFGTKKCGLDEVANDERMRKTIQMSSDETTLMLSTSHEFDSDIVAKDLGYKGNVLRCGYPRNDIIFQQKRGEIDFKEKISEHLGISADTYVILYAPTWRYDVTKKMPNIDYAELAKKVSEKENKPVVILTRMHHIMKANLENSDVTIDVTAYPDMQGLLAASDCLITDYSSSVWDFSILGKPIFLFAPDVEEYEKVRGMHISIYEWGFPVCKNSNELIKSMELTNAETGKNNAENFRKKYGSYEDGTACKTTAEWIFSKCFASEV